MRPQKCKKVNVKKETKKQSIDLPNEKISVQLEGTLV